MTHLSSLRALAPGQPLSANEIFEAINEAGSALAETDREADEALEIAIRLLEARRLGMVPKGCTDAIDILAEECGLYPYVDPARFTHITKTIIEAHAVRLTKKIYLHSKQMQIYLQLLNGENVILSAPTSFGKTLLVDALIAQKSPTVVVMIQPTIALIDESRRRLAKTFADRYQIITTSQEERRGDAPAIFILTQERLLQRADIESIDFLFVDEFYKLDPSRDDGRYETLNLALYKSLPKSRQIFMAGPHIRSVQLGARWTGRFAFVQTNYKTVTVNVIDRSKSEDRLSVFLADLANVSGEPSLVFAGTPATAESLMRDIVGAGIAYPSERAEQLSSWIQENYHHDWSISKGSAVGVIVHHGRVPRSLAQLFVRLFDAGVIKVLICTSTLIEGVNTSAANVFVYDKKISRTDFDFFSFANIRGRVGRMMRHFVGNAYLYHEAPAPIDTDIDIPILSDPGASTDYLLANVDRDDLSTSQLERQRALPIQTGVSEQVLRQHGSIGANILSALSERVRVALQEEPGYLLWKGFPNFEQSRVVADLALFVCHSRRDQTGLHSAKQVRWAWSQLGGIKSFPGFLRWFTRMFAKADDVDKGLDSAFQFLQACEFSFPRAIAAVEALIRFHQPEVDISYGAYIASMENWFRPAWMKKLDESGIPIPLSERVAKSIDASSTSAEAFLVLKELVRRRDDRLGTMDRLLVLQAAI